MFGISFEEHVGLLLIELRCSFFLSVEILPVKIISGLKCEEII